MAKKALSHEDSTFLSLQFVANGKKFKTNFYKLRTTNYKVKGT